MSYVDEVQADAPVAYWRFGEASGTTAADSSGNGNTGTYQGSPTLGTRGGIAADQNGCILLNGSSQYVTANDAASLDVGDTVTVEALIKLAATGSRYEIVNKGTNAYQLRLNTDGTLDFAKAGVAIIVSGTVKITDTSKWHHVVATKSGATSKLYLDGADVTGTVTNQTLIDTNDPVTVGRAVGAVDYFNGAIDEVAIYNKALPAYRVAAHYQAFLARQEAIKYVVRLREPFPPYPTVAEIIPEACTYGLVLMGRGNASFTVARSDPSAGFLADLMRANRAPFVTIERTDGAVPFVGWVTQYRARRSDPAVLFMARDPAGLLEIALTQRAGSFSGDSGELIRRTMREIDARHAPPLPFHLARVGNGPITSYEYRMTTALDFLETVANATGWEWGFDYAIGGQRVVPYLLWGPQQGSDERATIVLQEGVQLLDPELNYDATAFLAASYAIGGDGAMAARPAVVVNQTGISTDNGIRARAVDSSLPHISPMALGSAVVLEPQLSDHDSLFAAAQRARAVPKRAGRAFSFRVREAAMDMTRLHIGDIYLLRLQDTDLGSPLEADVRIVAIKIDVATQEHEIEVQEFDAAA
ncbi:MAG TPA: LamG domain-containing protein [Burkholderiales bacterium]|nr:LamG domain-containing protein [Burkholderiales bacterium]